MKLGAYLTKHDLTIAAFAKRANIEVSVVHRAVNLNRMPSEPTLRAIYEATAGQVTPNDFFGPANGEAA